MSIKKHHFVVLSGLIMAMVAILRLLHIGDTSLWLDEAVYANNSYRSFSDFIANTRSQNSSPILLPIIYWLLGDFVRDPFWVRIPPAVFGISSVYVLLRLKNVGLSAYVSVLSATWLALLSTQVQYSQEVREYSLSVLITCLLLYFFLKETNQEFKSKTPLGLMSVVFVAPLASYGNIFISAIIIGLYLAHNHRTHLKASLTLICCFAFSIALSYFVTAKYQMGVSQARYLVNNYPPVGTIFPLKWIAQQGQQYIAYLFGGLIPSAVAMIAMVAFVLQSLIRKEFKSEGWHVTVAFCSLVALSVLLALLGKYPFGGIRQQIFATPIALVSAALSLQWVFKSNRALLYISYALLSMLLVGSLISHRWSVYGEVQDIVSPVRDVANNKSNVFVYYGAIPAIKFHFPNSGFYLSESKRGDIDSMVNEIYALKNCDVYLVFSHIYKTEDEDLMSKLVRDGYNKILDKKYNGSRLVEMNRCNVFP